MDVMPLIPFLGVSVPESLVLYYMVLALTKKKESPFVVIILSLLTSIFSFSIRTMPVRFGIHTISQVALMTIFLNLFFRLPWHTSAVVMVLSSVFLGLAEGISVPLLAWIFKLKLEQIISDPLLRILFTLPHLILLAVLAYIIGKRGWRLPLISEKLEIKNGSDKRTAKQSIRQNCLLTLCLVQALMLVLLNLSFHAYNTGVYPSFTLKTLIEVGSIVLLVSVLATIFVSGYLLKVIEHDAKLETEIHYARERHNLHLDNKISGVPVINRENKVLVIVTEADLIDKEMNLHLPSLISILPGISFLDSMKKIEKKVKTITGYKVKDVMTSNVITVFEDTEIDEVIDVIVENSINRIPVLDKERKLVGIITRSDILRFISTKNNEH